MLVLARKLDEAIVIGDDITVRVVGVDKNGTVRLGIDAPQKYRILRQELLSEIQEANRAALAKAAGLQLPDLSALRRGDG